MSIADTIIVPESCRELFLNLRLSESGLLRGSSISGGGISELYPPYHIVRHNPSHHLFSYTFGGSATLKTPSANLTITPGEAILLPAGQLHDYYPLEYWQKVWLHIDDTEQWSFLKTAGYQKFNMPGGDAFVFAMKGFYDETFHGDSKIYGKSLANAYAEIICEHLVRTLNPNSSLPQSKRFEQMCLVWKEVDENLYIPWQVEDLARKMHISAVQFHRLNVKHFNRTPMKFLTELRMNKARHLLKTTSLNLEQIANMVGYDCAFSFSRAFKNHCKIPPSIFRS